MACVYHSDDVCSPGQVPDPIMGQCVCQPNHVPVKRNITVLAPSPTDRPLIEKCEPCQEHASVVGDKCVCDTGYVAGKKDDQGKDTCVTSNLGSACTGDAECENGDAHHCQIATGATTGYCTTTGCTTNADCNVAADYACATAGGASFCRKPPTNEGAVCTAQGPDPVCGAEAPFCILGECSAIGCAKDTDCSPSHKCCDLSAVAGQSLHACMKACLP